MKKNKLLIFLLLSLTLVTFGTGCSKKQIFEREGEEFIIKTLKNNDLENEVYYVKDGPCFYPTHLPAGTVNSKSTQQNDTRLFWLENDISLVPTCYKDGNIVYPSKALSLDNIVIERFKDLGHSFGLYGGKIDSDGYLCFSAKTNTVPNSSAFKVFNSKQSDSIKIVSIDGKKISGSNVSSASVISGLKKNRTYKVGFFSGTYYSTAEIKADQHFLQSYEMYNIDKAQATKNGYMSITMPDDAKSGYYFINGYGIYKYYAFNKMDKEKSSKALNEPYYTKSEEQMAVFSQQYVVSVKENTANVRFSVVYEATDHGNSDVHAIITAPNNKVYDLIEKEKGILSVDLKEAMTGRWKINISPKEIIVKDVKVDSTKVEAGALSETFSFVVSEASENMLFVADYTGTGEIWGIVENEKNESQTLSLNEKDHKVYASYPYLNPGTYTMKIYHHADTSISNGQLTSDDGDTGEETIVIEN